MNLNTKINTRRRPNLNFFFHLATFFDIRWIHNPEQEYATNTDARTMFPTIQIFLTVSRCSVGFGYTGTVVLESFIVNPENPDPDHQKS